MDTNHFEKMMRYGQTYDWVMSSRKEVDEAGNELNTIGVKQLVSASGKTLVDEVCSDLPLFVLVTNKLYDATIVMKYGIQFDERTHIHEDRLFNLEYVCHVDSVVMLPSASYNYRLNPKSLSHIKFVDPMMFVYSAENIDRLLRSGDLGVHMSEHGAHFMFNFYFRAMLSCLVYPPCKLSLGQRFAMWWKATRSALRSVLFRRYGLLIPRWFVGQVRHYCRKIC